MSEQTNKGLHVLSPLCEEEKHNDCGIVITQPGEQFGMLCCCSCHANQAIRMHQVGENAFEISAEDRQVAEVILAKEAPESAAQFDGPAPGSVAWHEQRLDEMENRLMRHGMSEQDFKDVDTLIRMYRMQISLWKTPLPSPTYNELKAEVQALREILHSRYIHSGYGEKGSVKQLTTEQKNLYADVIDSFRVDDDDSYYERWWQDG